MFLESASPHCLSPPRFQLFVKYNDFLQEPDTHTVACSHLASAGDDPTTRPTQSWDFLSGVSTGARHFHLPSSWLLSAAFLTSLNWCGVDPTNPWTVQVIPGDPAQVVIMPPSLLKSPRLNNKLHRHPVYIPAWRASGAFSTEFPESKDYDLFIYLSQHFHKCLPASSMVNGT